METNNNMNNSCERRICNALGISEDGNMYGLSDSADVSNIQAFWSTEDGTPVEVHFLPDIEAKTLYIIDNSTGEVLDELHWPGR